MMSEWLKGSEEWPVSLVDVTRAIPSAARLGVR